MTPGTAGERKLPRYISRSGTHCSTRNPLSESLDSLIGGRCTREGHTSYMYAGRRARDNLVARFAGIFLRIYDRKLYMRASFHPQPSEYFDTSDVSRKQPLTAKPNWLVEKNGRSGAAVQLTACRISELNLFSTVFRNLQSNHCHHRSCGHQSCHRGFHGEPWGLSVFDRVTP